MQYRSRLKVKPRARGRSNRRQRFKKKKKKESTRLVKKEQNDREIHNGVDEQYSTLTIVKILRVS